MICKDAHKMMDIWIDGELSPDKRTAFEHHLTRCRTCSAQAEDLRRLTALLGTRPPARPSSGLKKKNLVPVHRGNRPPGCGLLVERSRLGDACGHDGKCADRPGNRL